MGDHEYVLFLRRSTLFEVFGKEYCSPTRGRITLDRIYPPMKDLVDEESWGHDGLLISESSLIENFDNIDPIERINIRRQVIHSHEIHMKRGGVPYKCPEFADEYKRRIIYIMACWYRIKQNKHTNNNLSLYWNKDCHTEIARSIWKYSFPHPFITQSEIYAKSDKYKKYLELIKKYKFPKWPSCEKEICDLLYDIKPKKKKKYFFWWW